MSSETVTKKKNCENTIKKEKKIKILQQQQLRRAVEPRVREATCARAGGGGESTHRRMEDTHRRVRYTRGGQTMTRRRMLGSR